MTKDEADEAKNRAVMAHDQAETAKNTSERGLDDLRDLIRRISEFLAMNHANPHNIRMIAYDVLDMRISLTPEQIREMAIQINATVLQLTDIDRILRDTRDGVATANALKRRADYAKWVQCTGIMRVL